MTDRPKFFLHIGFNKTGTSSIQTMLHANRDALSDAGWEYLDWNLDYFAHHKLAYSISKKILGLSDGWQEDFFKAVANPKKSYIFSSELFCRLVSPVDAAEFFPPEQTVVIAYVRDHLSYLASWYAQAVQERNLISSFVDYAQIFSQPYTQFLSQWDAVYGRNRVIVRNCDREMLHGEDVRTDFLSFLNGVDPGHFRLAEGDSNLSISGNLLFFKRILNNYMTDAESRKFPIVDEFGAFAEVSNTFRGRFSIPECDVALIRSLFKQDVESLINRGVQFRVLEKEIVGNDCPNFETLNEELRLIKQIAVETNKKFLLYANRWQDWHSI